MQWWCAAQGVPWTWEWQAYPGVWLFVLALVGLHRGLRKRFPGSDRPTFRGWMYGLGVLALWIALDWPVGALGAGYLASLHMVQYLLIALIAPPLLLMGLPRGLYRALGESRLGGLLRVVSHPIAALSIFVAIMAWTHWPPVVDTLMVSQVGSFFLDLVWLFSGIVFWWPVAAPVPERSWLHEPGKVGYLIVATLVNTGVFAYLTFSPLPLYATYELAPPVTGLSTRDDQLLAGLFMKMGGAVILWTAITIIFFRWVARSDADGDGGTDGDAGSPGNGNDGGRRAGDGVRGAVAGLLVILLAACGGGEAGTSPDWVDAGPLQVATPVVGAPPTPGRAALYMSLRNPGVEPVWVVGVRAEGVGRAEVHRTSLDDGVMRMEAVERLPVGPGEVVDLRPGGLHVMLMEVERSLEPGGTVRVELVVRTGEGEAVSGVTAAVVSLEELESALGG